MSESRVVVFVLVICFCPPCTKRPLILFLKMWSVVGFWPSAEHVRNSTLSPVVYSGLGFSFKPAKCFCDLFLEAIIENQFAQAN